MGYIWGIKGHYIIIGNIRDPVTFFPTLGNVVIYKSNMRKATFQTNNIVCRPDIYNNLDSNPDSKECLRHS